MGMSSGDFRKPQINMTPMIDVLLVLIIISLLVQAPPPRGLDTLVPLPASHDAPAAINGIVITIRKDRTVRLNDELLDLVNLKKRLEALFRNHSNSVVFVRGDKELHFEFVAQVIDLAKGSGVSRIGLMTQ
jgi:biopolymer transport protein TolR